MYRLFKFKSFTGVPAANGKYYLQRMNKLGAVLTQEVSDAKLFLSKSEAEKFRIEHFMTEYKIEEA